MNDSTNPGVHNWNAARSGKERTAVQRSVNALLNELAPERALTRAERAPVAVEQHRTPTGCVLQAAASAVTVSWFAAGPSDEGLGELRIIAWDGVVTRRGALASRAGATPVSELVLQPVEPLGDACAWRDAGGTIYDVPDLAAKCAALLAGRTGTGSSYAP